MTLIHPQLVAARFDAHNCLCFVQEVDVGPTGSTLYERILLHKEGREYSIDRRTRVCSFINSQSSCTCRLNPVIQQIYGALHFRWWLRRHAHTIKSRHQTRGTRSASQLMHLSNGKYVTPSTSICLSPIVRALHRFPLVFHVCLHT